MSINEILHKALMAGIGVPEKVNEFIDDLVKKGELSESQRAKLIREFSEKISKSGEDISKSLTELINKALEKMNIPSRDEVEDLTKKVKSLSSRIKKLEDATKAE